jgi:hypothetical protein
MSMARRQPETKPDPDAVYVSVQGFAIDHREIPPNAVYPGGTRLRGSHPAVRHAFWNWVPDGASDDEIRQRQWELGAPMT